MSGGQLPKVGIAESKIFFILIARAKLTSRKDLAN